MQTSDGDVIAAPGTAIVTGGTGFVGGHLVRILSDAGWDVTVLTHRRMPDPDLGESTVIIPEDLAALGDRIARSLADHQTNRGGRLVVFHLATHFRAVHTPADIIPMIDANVTFGTALAEAATTLGADRFVNVGTIWQHFGGAPYSPVSLYAATKQAFADVLIYYREVDDLGVATVELADTYGAGDPRTKLVPLLVSALTDGRPVELSTGDQLLDLVHVRDAAAAILATANAPLLPSPAGPAAPPDRSTWSATSGAPVTIREFVALLEGISGRRIDARWGARPRRPREMLTSWNTGPPPPGWAPRISLAAGLRELIGSVAAQT